MWEQDFTKMEDGPLDRSVWAFDTGTKIPGYNHELEVYTDRPENVRIENGRLILEARREDMDGRHYTSARLKTNAAEGLTFNQGRLVVRAKIPEGQGMWPAIWLLSADNKYTKNSTDSDWNDPLWYLRDGEIDIMETYGMPYYHDTVECTVHTYDNEENDPQRGSVQVPGMYNDFHDYELDWTDESMTFLVDGKPFKKVLKPALHGESPAKVWPFDEEKYYLILNLAVGGTPFDGKPIDSNRDNWQMQVEKIQYFPAAA